MPGTRRSTVYDFADLRLHPDGSRTRSKYTTQDLRGNSIATDAAGLGRIPKRRKVPDLEEPADIGPSEEVALEEEPLNPRQLKRRKFAEDFSFLDVPPTPSEVPSSDLLKCIHYLASSYYTEKGLLTNASKQYRKERKERKLKRLELAQQGESLPSNNDDDENEEAQNPRKKKSAQIRDMYRMMDGSALIVIGMLIQEHIRSLASMQPPVGWEEMMTETETRQGSKEDGQFDEEDEDSHSVDENNEQESTSAA